MSSIIQRYEYDIFISYRHNDNLDGWVSDFVLNLGKAYNRHEMSMVNLKTDPGFKVLHGDPRFENLLLKIGSK